LKFKPAPPMKKVVLETRRIESAVELLRELEVGELTGDFSREVSTSLTVVKSLIQLLEENLGTDNMIDNHSS
jgi:hypothetical protein